jgi:hypothetical protein
MDSFLSQGRASRVSPKLRFILFRSSCPVYLEGVSGRDMSSSLKRRKFGPFCPQPRERDSFWLMGCGSDAAATQGFVCLFLRRRKDRSLVPKCPSLWCLFPSGTWVPSHVCEWFISRIAGKKRKKELMNPSTKRLFLSFDTRFYP